MSGKRGTWKIGKEKSVKTKKELDYKKEYHCQTLTNNQFCAVLDRLYQDISNNIEKFGNSYVVYHVFVSLDFYSSLITERRLDPLLSLTLNGPFGPISIKRVPHLQEYHYLISDNKDELSTWNISKMEFTI